MKNSNVTSQEILKTISNAKKIALFVHVRPDGDTIGSSFAFKLFLEGLGKECSVFSGEKLPDSVSFLEETKTVKGDLDGEYDLAIAIDSADLNRIGKFADYFSKHKNTVNIDHHISNTRYAKINYVIEKASNCENIYQLIKDFGGKITEEIAMFLALGILTDTGGLRHRNVTSSTLTALADLVVKGADINKISFNMFTSQTKERAELFGIVMSKIRYFENGRIAICKIMLRDLEKSKAKPEETEGFIDFVMGIKGVEIGMCIMQMAKTNFKVSLRSTGANVNEIAGLFGGGGHIVASGCRIDGVYEEVEDKLVFAAKQRLPE